MSECQQHWGELCQAIMVPCDGWEPVPRTASLQCVSASGPPLSSIWKSLSRGLTWRICAVHAANHLFPPCGQRQGSAPATGLSQPCICLGSGQSISCQWTLGWCSLSREGLAVSPHLCLLLEPPALSPDNQQASDRPELEDLIWSLCGSGGSQYNWMRWGQETRDRKAERWVALLWVMQWASDTDGKEPAGCVAWLQSTGQGNPCPLSLAAPASSPLSLLKPPSPMLQLRSSSLLSPVHMKKQTGSWRPWLVWEKIHSFPNKREVGVFRRQETLLVSCQVSSSVPAVGAGQTFP